MKACDDWFSPALGFAGLRVHVPLFAFLGSSAEVHPLLDLADRPYSSAPSPCLMSWDSQVSWLFDTDIDSFGKIAYCIIVDSWLAEC